MSSKVEILCPNGHRVTVKTTNSTTLMQVLEEACTKKGFIPASDYELRHGNSKKALDLTQMMRFSGLPNNAKLEMVKAAKSRELSNVTLALQLDTGDRIQKEFSPHTSLWDILVQTEADSGKVLTCGPERLHPVCVYMREEVTGELALRDTTLQKLGLIGGRAVIRLLYKAVEDKVLQEIEQKIGKERSRKTALSSQSSHSTTSEQCSSAKSDLEQKPDITDVGQANTVDSSEPMDVEEKSATLMPACTEADVPMESTEQTSSSQTSQKGADSSSQSQASGTISNIPGVQIFRPGEMQLSAEQEMLARQLAETIMPGVFPQRSEAETERLRQERQRRIQQSRPSQPVPASQQPVIFTEFKFPEETKGQDLYKNDLREGNTQDYEPCDRECIVYSLEDDLSTETKMEAEEPDDEFFEVTDSDVKRMWADLQKSLVDVSEQPLMTQAMRQAQTEARLAKYSRAFIRVTFPDKLVLQAVFRPHEPVYNLYKFVKETLEVKSTPFYLYTSPPKKVLEDKTQTMIQADLVPMCVVYFGSDDKQDHYLSQAAMNERSSQFDAMKVVMTHLPTRPSTTNSSGSQGTKRSTPQSPRSSPSQASDTGGGSGAKKAPKWFKMGHK